MRHGVITPTATEIMHVLLNMLKDGRRRSMDYIIDRVCKKMDVPQREAVHMYGPTHKAKSLLKKRGLVEVEYRGGPVAITPLGMRHLSRNPSLTMPEAVWIATAILHKDHGADELFTVGQIADTVADRSVYSKPPSKTSLQTAITGTCVANTNAASANHRLLYRAKPGKYRLYHKGDDYHKSRKGGLTCPKPDSLPPKYRELVKWYKKIYNKREMGDGQVLKKLITRPESDVLEFKSSLRYSKKERRVDCELEYAVAKAIAGFLNAKGGDILIGIDGHGALVGLADDFSTFKSRPQPVDSFQRHLVNVIDNYLGHSAHAGITIKMVQVDGKDACHCVVSRSPSPVYLGGKRGQEFAIRAGNTTKSLGIEEAVKYIQRRFGS